MARGAGRPRAEEFAMPNMMKLMKQAAEVQRDLTRLQGELAQKTVEFTSGGGMVKATARGDGTIAGVRIDPAALAERDAELLEDMILAAVNGAIEAAKEMGSKEMAKLTSGLGLPGMFGGKP